MYITLAGGGRETEKREANASLPTPGIHGCAVLLALFV